MTPVTKFAFGDKIMVDGQKAIFIKSIKTDRLVRVLFAREAAVVMDADIKKGWPRQKPKPQRTNGGGR